MKKKIILFSVALIIVSVLITSYISSKIIIKSFENNNQSQLRNYCSIINSAIGEELRNSVKPDYIRAADIYSKEIGERVTFVDPNGKVLGDSSLGANVGSLDNHKYRAEIKAALKGEIGISTRRSGTLGKTFLYVAEPLYYRGELVVVSRVAMELTEVSKMDNYIIKATLISGVIGILLALLLSFLYAGMIIRPIKSANLIADNIISNNFKDELFSSSKDEAGALVGKLNIISEKHKNLSELSNSADCKSNAILSAMNEAVILVDLEMRVTLMNNSAKQMFQLSDSDIGEYLIRGIRNVELIKLIKKTISESETGEFVIENGENGKLKVRTDHVYDCIQGNIIGAIALLEII